jgi:hypothetical protein
MVESDEARRPLGLTLLTGLYFFFFLVSVSTFGNPYPFLGGIYTDTSAKVLVFIDSLLCLYLFMGIMKRQLLTWYLLILYNLFQVANTIVNLTVISSQDIEKLTGSRVQAESLWTNNIAASLAILLLTQFIYRHKHFFTNRHHYLF